MSFGVCFPEFIDLMFVLFMGNCTFGPLFIYICKISSHNDFEICPSMGRTVADLVPTDLLTVK